jgi:outer membrane protein OmpA-like peptidoglycan-associated protein
MNWRELPTTIDAIDPNASSRRSVLPVWRLQLLTNFLGYLSAMTTISIPFSNFRRTIIAAALMSLIASPSIGQTLNATNQFVGNVPGNDLAVSTGANLSFVGGLSQIGIGIDRDFRILGNGSHILSEDAFSALIAQGWIGGGAGGFRIDYNAIPTKDGKPNADAWVRSFFAAIDQNRDKDRKLTLGAGLENEHWFGNVNLSRGLTKNRLVGGPLINDLTTTMSGSENDRPFIDSVVTTTTTQFYQRAYDYGIGVRAGTLLPEVQLRLSLGLDHEWGKFSSRQNTVSLSMEKFFSGSPHSIGLTLERYSRSGDFETDKSGTRALLTYRFSFGGSSYANQHGWTEVHRIQQDATPGKIYITQVTTSAPPVVVQMRKEKRIVKTTASMTSDAFFEFGKADLTSAARQELSRIAEILKTTERSGNIRLSGHTCDIGSEAYNLKLSLRRANAVRDYLSTTGLPVDAFVVEGLGENQPKYPNTKSTRNQNRRVDLEFVRFVENTEEIEIPVEQQSPVVKTTPPVSWKQEVIEREPIWVRRALRNTVPHKQTVDSYRGAEITQATRTTRTWVNRPPVAESDTAVATQGSPVTISVLANDSDPDGNSLTIVSVGAAAHGSVTIAGNAVVYTPVAGYMGSDSFRYTINDGAGGTASANVSVNVQRSNQAPIAANDAFTVSGSGSSSPLNVLANDSDSDGDPLTIVSFTQPSTGSISLNSDRFVFVGVGPFARTTFTYTISDAHGGTSTATVTLVDP